MLGFDLFILDCDGVLVDSELIAIRAMREVLNRAGVPATEHQVLGCFGMKQADALARIAAETGHAIPDDVPERLWPATRAAFADALRPMPGVAAVIERLPVGRRCVASSSPPDRIRTSLALTGLLDLFDGHLFSSQQVPHGKPAPDLFLLAAATMGVPPARCLVIEDSVFGIEAAGRAGMTAYGFTGGSHVGPDHAAALVQAGAAAVEADWAALGRRLFG